MNITLRIKRIYFDKILSGRKRIEFRDCKEYYDRMFENKDSITEVMFHYQQPRRLLCKIVKIHKITLKQAKQLSPEDFTGDDIQFGTHVWAIHLKDVIEWGRVSLK